MNFKRALIGAAVVAAALAGGTAAKAGTAIMASSGHPWVGGSGNISSSWGAFNIGDASVCANNSGSWVIPIPVPTSTGAVTHTITVDYGAGTSAEAWSFRSDGSVYSGKSVSASNANRTISVPAGGTLFAKGIMSSALAPACINTTVLVN
jgi:hypothetical protein